MIIARKRGGAPNVRQRSALLCDTSVVAFASPETTPRRASAPPRLARTWRRRERLRELTQPRRAGHRRRRPQGAQFRLDREVPTSREPLTATPSPSTPNFAVDRDRDRVPARAERDRRQGQVRRVEPARGGGRRGDGRVRGIEPPGPLRRARPGRGRRRRERRARAPPRPNPDPPSYKRARRARPRVPRSPRAAASTPPRSSCGARGRSPRRASQRRRRRRARVQ